MVETRKVEEKDIKSMTHVICEAWKTAYKDIVPHSDLLKYTDEDFKETKLREQFEKGLTAFLASVGGTDCGVISYEKYCGDRFENCAYIMQLYILPEYQKKGIGKELIEFLFSELKKQGYKRVVLNTLEKNCNARCFYEKLGFEFFGTEDSPLFSERVVRALYKREL